MQRILLSNDDGVNARGLAVLYRALESLAETTVIAPDRDRSGASNSLTLNHPLRVTQQSNGFWCVDGTPTDCVHLAITGWLHQDPDIVISGINAGANMGDDVLYSGTVAAATEGRFLGYPAIAVSLVGDQPTHYETAAQVVVNLLMHLRLHPFPQTTLLNVNVPNVPYRDLKGMVVTRLGNRRRAEPIIQMQDPRGRPVYWVGPPGPQQDAGPGTDFHAIQANKVSVTPIRFDFTAHDALEPLSHWMMGLESGLVLS